MWKKIPNSLSTIEFTNNDIEKIIESLDPNKTHDHNKINIRMLKVCGSFIFKALQFMFRSI